MPLGDIARGIGAAKSSTSNLCQVLEDGRMISRTATGYVLGRRTVELGGAYIARFNQIREFYDYCTASPLLSHEVVQIAMLDGTEVLYLARHEGRAPMRLIGQHRKPVPGRPDRGRQRVADHLDRHRDRRPVHRSSALPATYRAQRADPRRAAEQGPAGAEARLRASTTTRCTRASTASLWSCHRGQAATSRWRWVPHCCRFRRAKSSSPRSSLSCDRRSSTCPIRWSGAPSMKRCVQPVELYPAN